ncbi:branched-chain amino acid transport system substrate-binding protein [Bartonella apis]|uniref:Branched-chain amino acid transport system substrate-binding protein n=1 Tax=Bartonella apis TaxID=1686310 RepID=A0A1R0F725_9HYPH|nr:branched-chain amino acid transport system substrate-binding protein [Bartonella apis]OLY45628.1 branched-chain amino acid transport system substrate-binding protein [Bartonella apis]OLY47221.1 branched-chain amino acid transport system substrate-binding protein [Bartonella apis]
MRKILISTVSALALTGSLFMSSAYADIIIGFMGPITGPVAAYGIQANNGVKVAVDELNKNGGINGEKLVLKVFDDGAEPKQGVSAANQLIGEGIQYVIGPVTSNISLPVSNILEENDVLMITPSSTTPELSSRGLWNVFRTIGRDDQQGDYAADYYVQHLKDKRIAIIHDRATYGKGLADAFKAALNKGGVTEVLYGNITPGEKDYSVMVSRLKQEKVDYVYFGGYHPEAGLLLKQMREQGLEAPLIGGDGFNTSELWSIAGNAAEGTMFTNSVDVKSNPDAQETINALKAQNIPPETFAINGYAAIQVLAFGIEKAGSSTDPEAVATAIKSGEPIKTTLGEITYGDRGDITSKVFSMYKWHNGEIVSAE